MTCKDGTSFTGSYRLATTLTDARRHPASALVALYHQRWEHESAYFALRHTLWQGRVLRSADPAGVEQEMWAMLTLYQVLRTVMVEAAESKPGTELEARAKGGTGEAIRALLGRPHTRADPRPGFGRVRPDHRVPVCPGPGPRLSVMVGTGKGAQAGILIRSAEALETAHKLDTVVLDKTGTITAGKPALTDVHPVPGFDEAELLALIAAAEADSEHPLAAALVTGARDRGLTTKHATGFDSITGKGVQATVDGRAVLVGTARLLTDAGNGSGGGPVGPRTPNPYGQIVRWRENGGDNTALTFRWDIFLLAGDPKYDPKVTLPEDRIFGSPDGLAVDDDGRLWIQTDISRAADRDVVRPARRRFGSGSRRNASGRGAACGRRRDLMYRLSISDSVTVLRCRCEGVCCLVGEPSTAAGAEELERQLGAPDAVVIGLGSMIGAGIFAALAPAARAAGSGLLLGLGLAAVVAYCNATSSARLAARYPASGGTYVYGRERLGEFWGYLAGWGFVVGKTASCAAMALTVGAYVWPGQAHAVAVAAVVALTAVNYAGVHKSAVLTRGIVAVVLAVLAAVAVAALTSGEADAARLDVGADASFGGVLQAAGLLFFAFAGYARIATLGEEVRDPARTIPRAIPLALGITLVVYAVVAVAVLVVLGPAGLAGADAPLSDAARAAGADWLSPVVRVGAAVAALGSLLALILGVSRTTLAMARDRHLPHALSAVHPRFKVPHRAELVVGAVVAVVAATADVRGAIGFSSFGVLAYYAIANASAWTLAPDEGRPHPSIPALGMAGCLALAFALPAASVVSGAAVLAVGAAVYAVRRTVAGGRP